MATATLTEPDADVVAPAESTLKRRARRLGTLTTALAALLALGIATAFFVANESYGNNEATGGELVVEAIGLPLAAEGLFPSSAADGGPDADQRPFSIRNDNPGVVRYAMTAACTNCADPASDEAKQWENLRIIVQKGETVLYRGRLADMNADAAAPSSSPLSGLLPVPGSSSTPSTGAVALGDIGRGGASDYTARLWLAETGSVQPQGVLSTWTFEVSGRTV